MLAALAAARAVRGTTSPTPWVGAVAVRDGEIVAAGATEPPPGRHAERVALDAAAGTVDTLYVTLEPCAPFDGKRTPPCSDAIIEAGVRRVVVALEDPHPGVRGQGIARLRAAGIEVEVGDGRGEAITLLRPYLKHRQTGSPYIIAKWAASLDGRIATHTGDSQWITGEAAREAAHGQRAWVDAIMVGSGTAVADDPSLTARPGGQLTARQPVRIVLDGRGRTSPGAKLLAQPGTTIVATTRDAPREWRSAIVSAGAQVIDCETVTGGGVNLDQLLPALAARGIMSIWAEGGATVLGALFDGGHVDEVWAFLAPVVIGGPHAGAIAGDGAPLMEDAWRLREVQVERLGDDVLVRGYAGGWQP
jgi:diaminohydroxyphosphoribosylaminopyrimidine deaminase/5-amino-6-(5-phosphoribosylamino)uracil reductase